MDKTLAGLIVLAITIAVSAQSIIDEHCETDSDCLEGSFLFCNHWKTCACTSGLNLRFDHDTMKCALDIGADCYKEIEDPKLEPICLSHSDCRDYDSSPPGKGKCSCNHGFVRNATARLCEAKIYMVGQTCVPESPPETPACVENSSCTGNGAEPEEKFTCKCNPGWAEVGTTCTRAESSSSSTPSDDHSSTTSDPGEDSSSATLLPGISSVALIVLSVFYA